MQNKPNLLDAQMNVSSDKTKDYNNEQRTMSNERLCKANPNKPNFKRDDGLYSINKTMVLDNEQ